jgi:hypothetical protein
MVFNVTYNMQNFKPHCIISSKLFRFSAIKHTVLRGKNRRAKTGWLGMRIMCPSGAACLSADWFSELAL